MDIVTLGAALNGSAEYVNSHFKGGSNIQIVDNPDGTQTINASGEVSSEDTVARAEIAAIKDGETLDSFGDVETALADKVDKVSGKGLSSNDFTNEYKDKVDNSLSTTTAAETYQPKGDYATTSDISDMATETWVGQQGFLTSADEVPEVTSEDDGKVLKASYSGGTGTYSWQTGGGSGGTSDYTDLTNKPQINSVTLSGNKSLNDLGIAAAADIPSVPITEIQKNSTTISPVSGVVNITVPTTAADVSALPASTKYAGASTAGGSATSAAKLDTASAGSVTQPVYFANGVPTATTYSLEKSVPSNAVFTDTTYESKAAASGGTAVSLCTTGEKYTWNNKQSALTTTQLAAVNSGITSADVAQITTNENNISLIKQVPTVEAGDNGKVLTAGSSSYSWTTPTITGVKGGQESTYRTGKVSISAANILSTAQQNAVNSGVTSTTVSQVETNTTNISKITPTTTYKTNHAFQTANYELINDVYIDVPDGKRIFLVVGAKQANVTGIAVCFNTTTYDAAKIVISQEVSTAQQMISCAGCYDNGNGGQLYRLNVFAKGVAGSQLNCRVTLSWWYL